MITFQIISKPFHYKSPQKTKIAPHAHKKAQGTIIYRDSTLIHTETKTPYLIGSITGATGVYWTHSERVCIFSALQPRTSRLLSEKALKTAFLINDL